MAWWASTTSEVEFMSQHTNLLLVFLFHFELILLELVYLVANELHLLNLLGDLRFHGFGASILILEFRSQLFDEIVEARRTMSGRLTRPQSGLTTMLSRVEHLRRSVKELADGRQQET